MIINQRASDGNIIPAWTASVINLTAHKWGYDGSPPSQRMNKVSEILGSGWKCWGIKTYAAALWNTPFLHFIPTNYFFGCSHPSALTRRGLLLLLVLPRPTSLPLRPPLCGKGAAKFSPRGPSVTTDMVAVEASTNLESSRDYFLSAAIVAIIRE